MCVHLHITSSLGSHQNLDGKTHSTIVTFILYLDSAFWQ
ncbi:hypothetical protein NC651_036928 [Populus alba x Populus x berolinensis]|nr:hypothetical protein NC651_036928 [Populus alba x Populus x berolinensis]